MAKMLPPYCSEDVKSNAERRIFELLRLDPSTVDWICLHSLGLSKHVSQVYGEIDFVLLVPDEGVFCLEVKGGRVGRHNGKWTFTNRYGETTERAKSPFMQAREGMFSLREAIVKRFGNSHQYSKVTYGFGVVFPDIIWDQEDTEYEGWQVFDRNFRRPISDYVRQLSRHTHDRIKHNSWYQAEAALAPTSSEVSHIADSLRGDFETVLKPAVSAGITEQELIRLTQEQYRCLDALEANSRCLYEGGAGTGKTLLAMEYARREAYKQRSVLFLCFNRFLGKWIGSTLRSEQTVVPVESFHGYLDDLITKSSRAEEFAKRRQVSRDSNANSDFFQQEYPLFGLDAIAEGINDLFDTLVIDEGQDLIRSEYLDVLDGLVKGGLAGGRWAIFCDFHRQAIYSDLDSSEMLAVLTQYCPSYVRFSLTVNCRNTRPIIEETAAMSGFDTPPFLPSNTQGLSVDYGFYQTVAQQRDMVRDHINQLLEDGFAPEQISVLSRTRRDKSCLAVLPGELRCSIANLDEQNVKTPLKGSVLFSTIHAFKGLENIAVILIDIDRLTGSNEAALLYVGMSRARQRLIVLVSQDAKSDYNAAVKKKILQEMA